MVDSGLSEVKPECSSNLCVCYCSDLIISETPRSPARRGKSYLAPLPPAQLLVPTHGTPALARVANGGSRFESPAWRRRLFPTGDLPQQQPEYCWLEQLQIFQCTCLERVLVKSSSTPAADITLSLALRNATVFSNVKACVPPVHAMVMRMRCPCRNASFFECFSLCLSRACLGKMIIFIYKWRKKTRCLTALKT
jgi:hypothetical protein